VAEEQAWQGSAGTGVGAAPGWDSSASPPAPWIFPVMLVRGLQLPGGICEGDVGNEVKGEGNLLHGLGALRGGVGGAVAALGGVPSPLPPARRRLLAQRCSSLDRRCSVPLGHWRAGCQGQRETEAEGTVPLAPSLRDALAPRPRAGSRREEPGTRLREPRGGTAVTTEISIFLQERDKNPHHGHWLEHCRAKLVKMANW